MYNKTCLRDKADIQWIKKYVLLCIKVIIIYKYMLKIDKSKANHPKDEWVKHINK
jgi:hypothetical protein